MAILIKNPKTDALVRKVAKLKGISLTEAVHEALERELERETTKPSLVELSRDFAQRLRELGDPSKGLPADKEFIDSLYE